MKHVRGGTLAMGRKQALAAFLILLSRPILAWGSEVALGENGGVYTAPVQINRSVTLEFLVDPGAAVVVIPQSVLRRLVAEGSVTRADLVGIGLAETADRTVYEAAQVRLRELRVGDNVVRDVLAAVAPGLTQPLLGQSFLKRFAAVTFDNQRRVLILSNPFAAAGVQYPAAAPQAPRYPQAPATAPPSAYYGPPGYWPPAR